MATDPLAQARQAGYERSDASTRSLFVFFALMGAALLAVGLATAWLFGHLERTDKPAAFLGQPFESARPLPAGPRLQAQPDADIQEYVRSQQQLLNSHGWIDRQNGVARMPIDQAMARLLERGLPTRRSSTSPNGIATQPGSGTGAEVKR